MNNIDKQPSANKDQQSCVYIPMGIPQPPKHPPTPSRRPDAPVVVWVRVVYVCGYERMDSGYKGECISLLVIVVVYYDRDRETCSDVVRKNKERDNVKLEADTIQKEERRKAGNSSFLPPLYRIHDIWMDT